LLLFSEFDIVCSIDLDTILAGFWVSKIRNKTGVYDAHEYFTEVPEVVERPKVQAMWRWVANHTIPCLKYCYTVCESLAIVFKKEYGTDFEVIRNVPFKMETAPLKSPNFESKSIILYQGVLNDGRGLEEAIAAIQQVDNAELWLAGEGDLSKELRQLANDLKVEDKVKFLGYITPAELKKVTQQATIGLNLLQNKGLNYYYSLANKAFDYIQNGKPSINMKFPEYEGLNAEYGTFILIENLEVNALAHSINNLLTNQDLYLKIQENCLKAKEKLNWEKEEIKLVNFYKNVIQNEY
jgi:glycosyltransferase involved in cell wall biosynthesis